MDHFEQELARMMRDSQEHTPFEPQHRSRLRAGVQARRRARAVHRTVGSVLAVAGLGIGFLLLPHDRADDRPQTPLPRPDTSQTGPAFPTTTPTGTPAPSPSDTPSATSTGTDPATSAPPTTPPATGSSATVPSTPTGTGSHTAPPSATGTADAPNTPTAPTTTTASTTRPTATADSSALVGSAEPG